MITTTQMRSIIVSMSKRICSPFYAQLLFPHFPTVGRERERERKKKVGPGEEGGECKWLRGAGVVVGRDKWGRACPGRVRTCRGREVSVHVTRWGRGGVPVPPTWSPIPCCRLSPLVWMIGLSDRGNGRNNWRSAAVAAIKEGHLPLSLNCELWRSPGSPHRFSIPPPTPLLSSWRF